MNELICKYWWFLAFCLGILVFQVFSFGIFCLVALQTWMYLEKRNEE